MTRLGSGSFGTVVREGDFALKYTRDPFDAIKEFIWCSTLDHTNLIRHHDLKIRNVKRKELDPSLRKWFDRNDPSKRITDTDNTIGIIRMDACDSNLKRIIGNKELTPCQYDLIIKSVMRAIHYLHVNMIVHSDLKPDNILINYTSKKNGTDIDIHKVIVCDLGISNIQKYAEVHNTAPMYQSVELKPNIEHDIYSLGMVIMRVFNPTLKPIKTEEEKELAGLKNKGSSRDIRQFHEPRFRRFIEEGIKNIPSKYKRLVRRMTNPVGSERPTIQECMSELGFNIPRVKSCYSTIYLSDCYDLSLDRDFFRIEREAGLRRARMGCYALREFLHRKKLLNKKNRKVDDYMMATTIITHALYGSKRVAFPDITDWYDVVEELLRDKKFIINITTPSPYVREYRKSSRPSTSNSSGKSSSRSSSKRR